MDFTYDIKFAVVKAATSRHIKLPRVYYIHVRGRLLDGCWKMGKSGKTTPYLLNATLSVAADNASQGPVL